MTWVLADTDLVIEMLVGFVPVLLLLVVQTVVWIAQLAIALVRLPVMLMSRALRSRSARTLTA